MPTLTVGVTAGVVAPRRASAHAPVIASQVASAAQRTYRQRPDRNRRAWRVCCGASAAITGVGILGGGGRAHQALVGRRDRVEATIGAAGRDQRVEPRLGPARQPAACSAWHRTQVAGPT